VVITIYKPLGTNSITGGGYLVLTTNSAGQLAGTAGTKNNFGFNVKYNKAGTNLQGNINTIVRRKEADGIVHVYQIKGNSMTSLSANPLLKPTSTNPSTAYYYGKANIMEITNPLSLRTVDGGATLRVSMSDAGEPGVNDMIGITVFNKAGGVWYSSNWGTVQTVEQKLGGGNLVVH